MVTIFDGMDHMTKEQLCYEIALHEQVSTAAFAKELAQKAKKTSVQLAGKVTALFGKDGFSEPSVIDVEMQVEIASQALLIKKEEELRKLLKINLCRELEELGVSKASDMNRERLSVIIVSKAAEAVDGVPGSMTTLRKAEMIADKNTKEKVQDFRKTIVRSKMIKELLAHTVAVCVRAYGEKFSPAFVTMPGFLNGEELEDCLKKEKQITEYQQKNTECAAESTRLEHAMEMVHNQALTQQSAYTSFEEKEDYLMRKTTDQTDADMPEDIQKLLSETREHMEACLQKQKEYEEEYYAKQVELELFRKNMEDADRAVSEFQAERKAELEKIYQKAFPKLEFKDGVIASIARNFMYEDRISLEEAMMELCMAEHADNLDETLSGKELYSVCHFSLAQGSGRIAYHEKGDKILILQIQKSK